MKQTVRCYTEKTSIPEPLCSWLPPHIRLPLSYIGGCWEELHLRVGRAASVSVGGENRCVEVAVSQQDMQDLLMRVCKGSLYAFRQSIVRGYIPLPGGVRVGVCGKAATDDDGASVLGLQEVDTLCFRFPHRVKGVGQALFDRLPHPEDHGALIYAPPGVGKTTLLRALIRFCAGGDQPLRVAVVDSRCELSDGSLDLPLCVSVLSGYPKGLGMEIAVRSMNAQLIVCDEIGSAEEAQGVLAAANCGVGVIAAAHAASLGQLLRRPWIRELHAAAVFGVYVGIRRQGGRTDYDYDVVSWREADGLLCG